MQRRTQCAAELKAALARLNAGELDQAERLYHDILEREPQNAEALHHLGLVQHKRGQHAAALQTMRRSIELDRQNALYHHNLGAVQRHVGAHEQAIESLQRALARNPTLPSAHYNIGLSLLDLGKPSQALDAFRQTLAQQPAYADALFQMAMAFVKLNQFQDAVDPLERFIALCPGRVDARKTAVELFIRLDQRARALTHLIWLANLPGLEQALVFNELGVTYNALNRPQEALSAFQRALQISPDLKQAWYNSGDVLHALDRPQEALHAVKRALDLDPEFALARYLYAALSGETVDAPPADYVGLLFDSYAASFERHLLDGLSYHTPAHLFRCVCSMTDRTDLDLLDLGCGTGLAGAAFQPIAQSLVGIDLSPLMLEQARQRGLYRELICADVVEALGRYTSSFDLIVAADVLVYVGKLDTFFATAHDALRPGGWVALSIELMQDSDFKLQLSRRYAHSRAYIERLAAVNRFTVVVYQEADLRREGQTVIAGALVVLHRT